MGLKVTPKRLYSVCAKNKHSSLVGGWATPLKNMQVNWDDYSQYVEK